MEKIVDGVRWPHRGRKQLLLAILSGPLLFGTMNNCPNTTANRSVSNGSTSNAVTIPGAGPGNSLTTLGSVGCTAVDLTFSNFNNSTFTGAGQNGIETLAGTYLAETPAGVGNNPQTNPDTLLFATVRGTATSGADGNNNDGNNNWVTSGAGVIADQITYNVGNSGNNATAVIYGLVLTVTEPVIQVGGASGSIVVDICEGASPQTQITSAKACTTAGGTAFLTSTLTLATNPSQTLSVAFSTPVSALDITTVINLNGGGGPHVAGFDTFSEQWEESPEPSTLILLGPALAGVGLLLRYRRKKKLLLPHSAKNSK
ncbi:MAG TPA: hypothetical protein VNU44_17400 [Bryobacteraceae bacterium]|jgi:hypothetical protein|nr:hypothetical protein [Bryobacteraceae bacterium]